MGRGFVARAGVQARSSHIRKKAWATAAGGVQGLRVSTCLDQAAGGRSRKFSQPPELVCGVFPGHASTCPTFQKPLRQLVKIQIPDPLDRPEHWESLRVDLKCHTFSQ